MTVVQITTVNDKDDLEVLLDQAFKDPSDAHRLAFWWIQNFLKKGFKIVPTGIEMCCRLVHQKNNANVIITVTEEEL